MKKIWQFSITLCLYLCCYELFGQVDSTWNQKPKLNISGFMDVFYVYDFNEPQGMARQAFLFNHNRHNEVNLNLGFVKFAVNHQKYRANLALQTGTYANDNYSAEQDLLKNIFEANIGISLNQKNNIWIDAGVFPSHIGFESAISIDNWTMTRSILAENSPYFLTGAKLTFNPNQTWEIAVLLLNGWQRIQRLEGNSLPSFGTQLKYVPNENLTLNWSTFVGTDDPDSVRRMRYFNNIYGQFQLSKNLALIAGFDIGTKQNAKLSSKYDTWLSPVIIGKVALNKTWYAAIRVEYYKDQNGIIIAKTTKNGFQTTGVSFNLDYKPIENILWRLEARTFNSTDRIFENSGASRHSNLFVGTSIAIKFSESIKN